MTQSRPLLRRICLALPAYNEEAAIEPLLERAIAVLATQDLDWNIIVVDDGSRDRTAALVEQFAAKQPRVSLVRHPQNRGLGGAIITCLKSALEKNGAAGTLVVSMDADVTHPPETIPAMRQAAEAGADLVIASRFQPGSQQVGVPPFRQLMSFGARHLFRFALGLPGVRDYTCGFRAFRGELLERGFAKYGDQLITRSGFACTDEILVKLAVLDPVIREVPFVLRYDLKVGQSKMRLGLTIVETLKLLHSFRKELRTHRR